MLIRGLLLHHPHLAYLIPVIIVWELIWRGFALWKAARKNQSGWFVAIIVFNTVGILPIIYLIISKNRNTDKTGVAA